MNDRPAPPTLFWPWLITLTGIGLLLVRMAGPFDLADGYHQERQACYVQDILQNGHWICQRDVNGEIASKPPLHAWLAALLSLPFPKPNRWTLTLPGAFATIGLGLLIFFQGRKYFGGTAAGLGGLTYLISSIGAKQIALVRIDGLFAFTVVCTALATFAAWNNGKGWTFAWLAGALATLAKGPLALLLAGAGLAAVFWERRDGQPASLRGSHGPGIALFALITVGWFLLAYLQEGQALIDKVLFTELFRHAVTSSGGAYPGSGFYQPPLYFLSRFAPWSLLAIAGLWRISRRPAAEPAERRFERYLFCYLLGGLLIFSIAAHQRPDLLFPLYPMAALLAGRELDRLWPQARGSLLPRAAVALAVVGLLLTGIFYKGAKADHEAVLRTQALKQVAREVEREVGQDFPLTYVDSYYTFQFYLNTMSPRVSLDRADQLLRGSPAAYVVVRDLARFKSNAREGGTDFYVLKKVQVKGGQILAIVSNRPRLEWSDSMSRGLGPFTVRTEQTRLRKVRGNEFRFASPAQTGQATIRNFGPEKENLKVIFACGSTARAEERALGPREEWTVGCR